MSNAINQNGTGLEQQVSIVLVYVNVKCGLVQNRVHNGKKMYIYLLCICVCVCVLAVSAKSVSLCECACVKELAMLMRSAHDY